VLVRRPVNAAARLRADCPSGKPPAVPDDAVQVAFNPLIVNRDDITQGTQCRLSHGGSLLAVLVAFGAVGMAVSHSSGNLLDCK
jgi:hypothetical protein